MNRYELRTELVALVSWGVLVDGIMDIVDKNSFSNSGEFSIRDAKRLEAAARLIREGIRSDQLKKEDRQKT